MQKDKIDFIGIGAARSGTTWLASTLRQHPEIFVSEVKEINYFNKYRGLINYEPNKNYKNSLKWYHNFFKNATGIQKKGEFTPSYMRNKNCPRDIYNYNPDIKLIAILRNPFQRMLSQYLFGIQWGIIPAKMALEDAIEKYPVLLSHGLYYQQLLPYFEYFPEKNLKVLIFEKVMESRKYWLNEICNFLEINGDFEFIADHQINETKSVKSPKLNYLIRKTHPFFNSSSTLYHFKKLLQKAGVSELTDKLLGGEKIQVQKVNLNADLEKHLKAYYIKDVIDLEKLLGPDLSEWKNTLIS